MTADYELTNNKKQHQYEFHIDGYIPRIEYILSKNGEIHLTHTEVPVGLEGKGIGSQLVEKTLADIKERGLQVVPLCPFVVAYIQRHPEWKQIVMKGINL